MEEKRQEVGMHESTGESGLGGGSIVATYQDAIAFFLNKMKESQSNVEKLVSAGAPFEDALKLSSLDLDGILSAIEFIYGKAPKEVRSDVLKQRFKEFI